MKQLFLALSMYFIFSSFVMGQEENTPKDILDCITEVGKDTVRTLNSCESKYLNYEFQKDKGTFDFCCKKVAFFKGNVGTIQRTKKDFFDDEKYILDVKGFLPLSSDQLLIFNEDEAKQVGYNAVIISSSKKLLSKKEVINRLKRNNKKLQSKK